MMAVKVDPANVVAIPSDYGNQKGRAWTYEVIAHVEDAEDILRDMALYIVDVEEEYDNEW